MKSPDINFQPSHEYAHKTMCTCKYVQIHWNTKVTLRKILFSPNKSIFDNAVLR